MPLTDREHRLLAALEGMHDTADTLMAALIMADPEFMPSTSGVLPAFIASKNAIDEAKGAM